MPRRRRGTGGRGRRRQERRHVDAVHGLRRPLAGRVAAGAGREAGRMRGHGVTLRRRRCDQQVIGAAGLGGRLCGWWLDGGRPGVGVDGFAEDAVGDGDHRREEL